MKAALLALLVASPLAAQEVQTSASQAVQSRYGAFQVAGAAFERSLLFRGAPIRGIADTYLEILGAWAREGEDRDWLLIEISHSGNMCPSRLILIRAAPDGVSRTGEFGECIGPIRRIELRDAAIELTMADPDAAIEARRYVFDGTMLSEEKIMAGAAPAAGVGVDVTRWIEADFSALAQDAGERARFETIMSLADIETLRRQSGVGGQGMRQGDWVVGRGCQPHNCNAATGLWAIRIADGAPVAVLWWKDRPAQYFGAPDVLNDPVIADLTRGFVLP